MEGCRILIDCVPRKNDLCIFLGTSAIFMEEIDIVLDRLDGYFWSMEKSGFEFAIHDMFTCNAYWMKQMKKMQRVFIIL